MIYFFYDFIQPKLLTVTIFVIFAIYLIVKFKSSIIFPVDSFLKSLTGIVVLVTSYNLALRYVTNMKLSDDVKPAH